MHRAKRNMSPQRLSQIAMESGDFLAALSHRLDRITAGLADNDLSTHVNVLQLPSLIAALQKVANRVFSGLVLAGLLVASAMLLPYWRAQGTAGFVIAAAMTLYMGFFIMMSDQGRGRD